MSFLKLLVAVAVVSFIGFLGWLLSNIFPILRGIGF